MAKQDVTVELFYNGVWNTAPVYVRNGVTITRGRGDETAAPSPQSLTLTLDNRTGDYNPRNATSPLYGLVGRNTPIRVSVDGQVRFYGEVASWKPGRTVDFNPDTGKGDAWTQVEAAGILRRLDQGADVLASPLRRTILGLNPTAYWPLEDSDGAAEAASAVPGVPGMQPFGYSRFTAPGTGEPLPAAGLPKFGSGTGIPGSLPVPDFTQGGVLVGRPPVPASGSQSWRLALTAVFPRDQQANGTTFVGWTVSEGTYPFWEMQADGSGIFLTASDSLFNIGYGTSTATINLFDGQPHFIEVAAQTVSGALDARIFIDGWQYGTVHTINAPNLAFPPGWITAVTPNVKEWTTADTGSVEGLPQIGHIAVWQPKAAIVGHMEAMLGHVGEAAIDRFNRLCDEEGIDSSTVGAGGIAGMGVQRAGVELLELLGEVERTDGGIIYEPRDELGVVLRTVVGLYNQDPALTVDWSAGQVAVPFDPVVDDQGVRNDVTAKSTTTAAEARSVLEVGAMSVQPPPDGVGRYNTQVDVNPALDLSLPDHAGWARHKGTVDETRYPRVTVDLVASPELAADAEAVDIGDRIAVANLPADMGSDAADLIVLGYTEQVGSHTRTITFNAAPASPYTIATADGDPRVAADGSTLAADLTSSATSLLLASSAVNGPWTTTAVPLDMRVGGERVTASGIAPMLNDNFGRTVGSGWGTAPGGLVWDGPGSVNGNAGVHTITSAGTTLVSLIGADLADVDVAARIQVPTLAVGAPITAGVVAWTDDDSSYILRAEFNTDQSLELTLFRIAGGTTALASAAITRTFHSTGSSYWVRLQAAGGRLRGHLWPGSADKPPGWDIDVTDATPITTPGRVGCRTFVSSSYSGTTPLEVRYLDFVINSPQTVTLSARAVNGVSRAWDAGTPVDVWQPAVSAL